MLFFTCFVEGTKALSTSSQRHCHPMRNKERETSLSSTMNKVLVLESMDSTMYKRQGLGPEMNQTVSNYTFLKI
jgi:hypothetical protein